MLEIFPIILFRTSKKIHLLFLHNYLNKKLLLSSACAKNESQLKNCTHANIIDLDYS